MKSRALLVLAVLVAVGSGSLVHVAEARKKDTAKVPARIHFSGNFEGELEPCG